MRVVVFGVVAFAFGLAGATVWAARVDGPPALAAASADTASVRADSMPAEAMIAMEPRATAMTYVPLPGSGETEQSVPNGRSEDEELDAAEPIPVAGSGSSSIHPPTGSDGVGYSSAIPLGDSRLGKIFTAMQPREAARVLEQMSDHDVGVILGMVTDRQAAAILSNLPPERAAGISRDALRSRRSGP